MGKSDTSDTCDTNPEPGNGSALGPNRPYIFKAHSRGIQMAGHGGRRAGAGRPAGSGWRSAVSEMRAVAVERRTAIAASDRDPLNFLIDTVWDEGLDRQTRLSAA